MFSCASRAVSVSGPATRTAAVWLCPPAYVRDVAVPALERGRRRAGKPLAGFDVVAAVPLAVCDERAAALSAFCNELKRYLEQPFYRAMLQAAGLGDGVAAFDRQGEVPQSLAEALGGIGDERAASAYVEAYRKAGVTLPAVRPITFPDASWYRRTLEAAAAW